MAKPTIIPLWNTAKERVLEPTATQRATGWVWTGSKFEKPKGETLNFWMNNVGEWIKYFDEEVIPSSPIAKYVEYTATGGETNILTDDNTDLQVYKNDVLLLATTDYTLNVDGVTIDLTTPLILNDFVQWYDLKKLKNSFYEKSESDDRFISKDINALTAKTTPVDADELMLGDSASSFSLKKLTFANLKAYFDTLYSRTSAIFGIGQTWQNVTASRVAGVTYTNTTGKPIFISITRIMSGGVNILTVNGVDVSTVGDSGGGAVTISHNSIVPKGGTYSVTAFGTNVSWAELR